MKSFTEFRKELEKKRQERKNIPVLETQFGSHSLEKHEVIKEDADGFKDHHYRSDDEHKRLHKTVAPLPKISVKEMQSIKEYSDESRPINVALHLHHEGNPIEDQDIVKHIHYVSDALDKSSVTEDTHVYTGLTRSPGRHFTDINSPQIVHLPAFVSTSTSLEKARGFSGSITHHSDSDFGIDGGNSKFGARHVLKIEMPKGTKAMSIKKHAFAKEENEILLHRGYNIEIHPKVEIHHNHLNGEVTNIWHGKIVEHNPKKI